MVIATILIGSLRKSEQSGATADTAGAEVLRIADCPKTFSPMVNLTVIFSMSFSADFAPVQCRC
jgi:hypothetical protein